jgi:2-hydroxy-3-oxopropionate reductase
MSKQRVAVIGIGIMGSAITRRLLACGHQVSVYDRNPPKVAAVAELGALPCATPAQAASASDFVITSLNSASAVEAIVFGPDGVTVSAAGLLIDMSSIDPPSTRRLAARLRESTGMGWVDAPLSGGAPKALTGQLTVMAGGSSADVQRARLVMDDLCANYTHMGDSGAGQTTKLVNQLLCAAAFQAVAEAVRLAQAGGVNAALLPTALAGGRADSAALREFAPKMAAGDVSPSGRIDNMLKDLEGVQALASSQRLPLPLTATLAELHRSMVAAGMGPADTAAIMWQFSGFRPPTE